MGERLPARSITAALVCVLVAGAAELAAVDSAGGSARATALIRPGMGIGKVRLGMTVAQVRRALGPPHLINRRARLGFGRSYVEYAWDYGWWLVAFAGPEGRLRAVRIATRSSRERTRNGLGVDSRPRAVLRRYPDASCRMILGTHHMGPGQYDAWLAFRHAGGRLTIFSLDWRTQAPPTRIDEVIVKEPVREVGAGRDLPCPARWLRVWAPKRV
jgi:hypothetical protein